MNKPKFFTPKFIENAVRFVVYFLAVALTPLLAKPLASLFAWVGYGAFLAMFKEIFTVLLWGVEGLAIYFVEKAFSQRAQRLQTEETASGNRADGEKVGERTQTPEGEQPDKQLPCDKEGGEETKPEREHAPPMPLKNLGILTGICILCVLLVSAVIGFRVKPFYDIGENISGQELCSALAVIGRNAFKCLWIVSMLGACKCMAEEIVATEIPDGKAYQSWLIAGGILLLYGIFDVFVSVVSYPMGGKTWLMALVYLLFYAAFTAVYCFTEQNKTKSYFLILFIYLF